MAFLLEPLGLIFRRADDAYEFSEVPGACRLIADFRLLRAPVVKSSSNQERLHANVPFLRGPKQSTDGE